MATNERSHNVAFAKGGKTKMFGKQAAEPSEKGVTADTSATDSAPGAKFASGGSTKMIGYRGAEPAQAGKTSPC